LKEAGALTGMADVAIAKALGFDEHRVLVAVDEHVANPVVRVSCSAASFMKPTISTSPLL